MSTSPRPWRVEGADTDDAVILDARGLYVVHDHEGILPAVTTEDAALIVEAVNGSAGDVAALRERLTQIVSELPMPWHDDSHPDYTEAVDFLIAAGVRVEP